MNQKIIYDYKGYIENETSALSFRTNVLVLKHKDFFLVGTDKIDESYFMFHQILVIIDLFYSITANFIRRAAYVLDLADRLFL